MGPEESQVGIIWIELRIRVSMVRTMSTRPPLNRALNSASASKGQEILEWL
jgi:hypothetical protein